MLSPTRQPGPTLNNSKGSLLDLEEYCREEVVGSNGHEVIVRKRWVSGDGDLYICERGIKWSLTKDYEHIKLDY